MGLWEGLSPEERRQGFVIHYLIGDWDRWVKRRSEQIELVTDSRVRRRISVDFRLHSDVFGPAATYWGDDAIHYVPLSLLEKAPFMHFDLRDESGAALPLITRRKSAALGAAALSAAAKVFVVRQFLMAAADPQATKTGFPETKIWNAIRTAELRVDAIELPELVESKFMDLCYLPFRREAHEQERLSASDIWRLMLQGSLREATELPDTDVTDWDWFEQSGRWRTDQPSTAWFGALLSDPIFAELAFDFARLFMVCAPINYEEGRRRVIKFQYEESLLEPGLRALAQLRNRWPSLAGKVRRSEDKAEGLRWDSENARREWILPPGTSNRLLRRPTVPEKLARGAGWRNKLLTFELPGMGFGGTFHLEFTTPEGTQLRRAKLRAAHPRLTTGGIQDREDEFARRYARNITMCHLYLGGLRPGSWGEAFVAIKPSSSTIVRGAALSAMATTFLITYAYCASNDLAQRPATVVALLLLAPGLIAAQLARPDEHPMTTGMLFGLRLLTLSVAGVALGAAALLGAGQSSSDNPIFWNTLLVLSLFVTVVLARAWRLAGRDWPRESEV